jgi:hypothetical protein
MIRKILSSKNFVACLLGAATGMALYFKLPWLRDLVRRLRVRDLAL